MDENTLRSIADQLRQPKGEYAIQVGEKMNEGNLHINLTTIEALKLSAGDNILEIGMGNGFFVKDILNVAVTYTGCDFSERMVEEACRRNEKFIDIGQAKFFLSGAEKLPFENNSFDKIFSVNTLYFWDNPRLILSEIHRLLKPGGRIIIAVRPRSVMEKYPFTKFGFTMYDKNDLVKLLSGNNFKINDVIEKVEPEQEMNGEKVKVETLIITAEKI